MAVDRCVCRCVTFREMCDLASRAGLSFDEIVERTGCTTACGLCEPYARLAVITGVCDLPALSPEQIGSMLAAHAETPRRS